MACKLKCIPRYLVKQPMKTQIRHLQVSLRLDNQDDDKFKDDPDVRNILGDIKKAFDKNTTKSEDSVRSDDKVQKPIEPAPTSSPPEKRALKDMTALLAEIYGSKEQGGGKLSGVGKSHGIWRVTI